MINLKMINKIKKDILDNQNMIAFEKTDEAELSNFIDTLPDPSQVSIVEDLAVSNFKLTISSPKKGVARSEKIYNKIILLQYAGYNNREIAEKLKISPGRLRTYVKRIKDDDSIINLKMNLK